MSEYKTTVLEEPYSWWDPIFFKTYWDRRNCPDGFVWGEPHCDLELEDCVVEFGDRFYVVEGTDLVCCEDCSIAVDEDDAEALSVIGRIMGELRVLWESARAAQRASAA